jgi:hypothetical protein
MRGPTEKCFSPRNKELHGFRRYPLCLGGPSIEQAASYLIDYDTMLNLLKFPCQSSGLTYFLYRVILRIVFGEYSWHRDRSREKDACCLGASPHQPDSPVHSPFSLSFSHASYDCSPMLQDYSGRQMRGAALPKPWFVGRSSGDGDALKVHRLA